MFGRLAREGVMPPYLAMMKVTRPRKCRLGGLGR